MKIFKIEIENYRLLKDFSIDIEKELSLVIGKNNRGKTSFLSVMNKFINGNSGSFAFEDFNLDFINNLIENIDGIIQEDFTPIGIKMRLFIEYNNEDNLSNISSLMMDLNPDNNTIILSYEYILIKEKVKKLIDDFKIFGDDFKIFGDDNKSVKEDKLRFFLKHNYSSYFQIFKKTIDPNDYKILLILKRKRFLFIILLIFSL